ncbi:MAG: TlpA family protein disulfide reductase [Saprospiraceae bacterium]|nr:TlpA family protein disulfide reductase [Saprospiraceae bacterium]
MKLLSTIGLVCIFMISTAFDANFSGIPAVDVKTLEGKTVSIKDYIGKGNLTVMSFWATWCSPCKRELDAIAEIYPDWQEEYGVEILAVTIDDARTLAKVPALVETKGWEYTVLADVKRELQKALNFQTIPQTFLLNGDGEIVYTHSGYNPGDEYELEEEIKKNLGK